MRLLAFRGALAALVLAGCLHGPARATPAQAAIYPTDLWATVDPVAGTSIRVHLYVHSASLTACSAQAGDTKSAPPSLPFSPARALSDKDGTLALTAVYPATARPGRRWITARCTYPTAGSGNGPQATYQTSFVLPPTPQRVVPQPDLRVWLDPKTPRQNATVTVYAKTLPGALCSAYFEEESVWYPGDPIRAGTDGIAKWGWTFQEHGTAYVTCDAHKTYARSRVAY